MSGAKAGHFSALASSISGRETETNFVSAQLLFICGLAICMGVLRWFVIQNKTDGASIAVRHSFPKG
jgi:hypothetical protein